MPTYLAAMAVGRIAGLFDAKPAHFLHRLFASVHAFSRSVGEFLYPARALKDVAVAHSNHTMTDVEVSYVKLMKRIPPLAEPLADAAIASNTQAHSIFSEEDSVKSYLDNSSLSGASSSTL